MPKRFTFTDYPFLDAACAGSFPNLGYGKVERLLTHCIVSGIATVLASDVNSTQTSITVLEGHRFPTTPFVIQVGQERMSVSNVSGQVLTVSRGYDGTSAVAHGKGRTVFEVRTEYIYLVSPIPVKSIGEVYVDNVLVPSGYTAYTGQSGDEHTGWPGKAVISFTADAEIRRQFKPEDTASNKKVQATVKLASHKSLATGSPAGVDIAGLNVSRAWVAYTGYGDISTQTYKVSVRNNDASNDSFITLVARASATGSVVFRQRALIPAASTKQVELGQDGGEWDTDLQLLAEGPATFTVFSIVKEVTVVAPLEDDALDSVELSPETSSLMDGGVVLYPSLKPKSKILAWAGYADKALGAVGYQVHKADVSNPGASDAIFSMMGTESDGTLIERAEFTVPAGESANVSLVHLAGGWDAATKVNLTSGELMVKQLGKEVWHVPTAKEPAENPITTASSRFVVGDAITADVEMALDASGDYGGTGTLIERPDWVMKHFIVELLGRSLSDIDSASFSGAGSFYATAISGGYKFGGLLDGSSSPSDILSSLAFQCRSTIKEKAGKWYLDVLADTGPSAVKAISMSELAGDGAMFTFENSSVAELGNKLTARYKRSFNSAGEGWEGVVELEDTASVAKYGPYPRDYHMDMVRLKTMAEDVLAHALLQRKNQLLTVKFPVFYEHFDLKLGDTIAISNAGLNDTRKYYIESIKRSDVYKADIKAIEWWA